LGCAIADARIRSVLQNFSRYYSLRPRLRCGQPIGLRRKTHYAINATQANHGLAVDLMSFEERAGDYIDRVEITLSNSLPDASVEPRRLHEAMRYSVLGGGKRIRPLLVYATGEMLQVDVEMLDAPAAAVEIMHAFSLVHDDLPAMDDDDLRRGTPTTHREFDEATAILAADALQPLAFNVLATSPQFEAFPAQKA